LRQTKTDRLQPVGLCFSSFENFIYLKKFWIFYQKDYKKNRNLLRLAKSKIPVKIIFAINGNKDSQLNVKSMLLSKNVDHWVLKS